MLQYFKPAALVGFTPIPNRRDNRDIRELFGKEVFKLELPEAIARNIVCNVDYRLMNIAENAMDDAPFEIMDVKEPQLFSFSWVSPDEEMERAGGSTLVSFDLTEEGEGTHVRLTESNFAALQCSDEDKNSLIEKHTSGWQHFLSEIQSCAVSLSN